VLKDICCPDECIASFFFAETFWSLKHLGHFSHSCGKTCYNSFSAYIFRHSDQYDFFSVNSKSICSMAEKWPKKIPDIVSKNQPKSSSFHRFLATA